MGNLLLQDQDFGPGVGGIFSGIHIRTSDLLVKHIEDWSRVRSKGRAKRRMRRGYRQNIAYREVPDPNIVRLSANSFVCHPAIYDELRRAIKQATR